MRRGQRHADEVVVWLMFALVAVVGWVVVDVVVSRRR